MIYFIETLFGLSLFLNALLFIPQAYRLYRHKTARGISLMTFIGFNFIQFFTILHGYLKGDYALMIGFSLSFLTCACVSVLAWYYRDHRVIKD